MLHGYIMAEYVLMVIVASPCSWNINKKFANKHTYCTCSLAKRVFNCNRWLAVDEADGKVCVLLCHNFICINTCEAKSIIIWYHSPFIVCGGGAGGKHIILRGSRGGSVVAFIEFKRGNIENWLPINSLTPKIWLLILPSSCYTFRWKSVVRI